SFSSLPGGIHRRGRGVRSRKRGFRSDTWRAASRGAPVARLPGAGLARTGSDAGETPARSRARHRARATARQDPPDPEEGRPPGTPAAKLGKNGSDKKNGSDRKV